MSHLSAYDKRKCAELGASILRVTLGVKPAAALIFATASEHVARDAQDDERVAIAALLMRAALRIEPSILDSRH